MGVTKDDFESIMREAGDTSFKASNNFNINKIPDGYVIKANKWLENDLPKSPVTEAQVTDTQSKIDQLSPANQARVYRKMQERGAISQENVNQISGVVDTPVDKNIAEKNTVSEEATTDETPLTEEVSTPENQSTQEDEDKSWMEIPSWMAAEVEEWENELTGKAEKERLTKEEQEKEQSDKARLESILAEFPESSSDKRLSDKELDDLSKEYGLNVASEKTEHDAKLNAILDEFDPNKPKLEDVDLSFFNDSVDEIDDEEYDDEKKDSWIGKFVDFMKSGKDKKEKKEKKGWKPKIKSSMGAVAASAVLVTSVMVGAVTKGFGFFDRSKSSNKQGVSNNVSVSDSAGSITTSEDKWNDFVDNSNITFPDASDSEPDANNSDASDVETGDDENDPNDTDPANNEDLNSLPEAEFDEKIAENTERIGVDENAETKSKAELHSLFGLSYTFKDGDKYYASADQKEFIESGGKSGFGTIGGEFGLFNDAGTYSVEGIALKDANGNTVTLPDGTNSAWDQSQLQKLMPDGVRTDVTFSVHVSRWDDDGHRHIAGWVDLSPEDTKKFIASLQQYQTMPFQIDQNESSEASLEEKIADGAEFVKENYTRADMLKDIENIANEDPEAFAKLGLKFTRSAKNDRIYVQNVIDNGERGIGYSFATDNELAWAIASYSLGI